MKDGKFTFSWDWFPVMFLSLLVQMLGYYLPEIENVGIVVAIVLLISTLMDAHNARMDKK